MTGLAIIAGILVSPLVIGWLLRVTGISKGPGSGDSDGGFVDFSSSDGGGSDGGGGGD